MSKTLFIIFSFWFILPLFSQSKDDNFFSHKNDKEIIESVLDSLKKPNSLESLFLKSNNGNYKSLGFNYKIYSSIIYRKKLVITCDFLYLKDSLISYVLKPKLPNSKRLQKKHLKFYNNTFEVTEDNTIKPLFYNYETFYKPLKYYKGKRISNPEIDHFMSTESGLYYGEVVGIYAVPIENWKLLLDLEDQLTSDVILQLLYSKNPVSRLNTIKYYYLNSEKFADKRDEIENTINWTSLRGDTLINSVYGCFSEHSYLRIIAKQLEENYIKQKTSQD